MRSAVDELGNVIYMLEKLAGLRVDVSVVIRRRGRGNYYRADYVFVDAKGRKVIMTEDDYITLTEGRMAVKVKELFELEKEKERE